MNLSIETNFQNLNIAEWNALVQQNSTNTIYQTYQWHKACWDTYRDGKELYLLCARDNGHLAAIAPFMRLTIKGRKTLRFLGSLRADYSDIIFDKDNPKALNEIVKFLMKKKDDWDEIFLENLPEKSITFDALVNQKDNINLPCKIVSRETCPTIILNDEKNRVQEILSKKSLKRHHDYFKKMNNYSVQHLHKQDEVGPLLSEFFKQHIDRWSVTKYPSLFLEEDNCRFYKNLVNELNNTDWLTFTAIKANGKPIAFHYGFTYNNTFIWYKPSFDITLHKKSPGEALLKELIQYSVDKNYREFDFSVGNDPFKQRFANKIHNNATIKIVHSKDQFMGEDINQAAGRIPLIGEIMRLIKRVGFYVKEEGLLRGVRTSFNIILSRLFEHESVLFYTYDKNKKPQNQIQLKIDYLNIQEGSVDDLLRLNEFKSNDEKHSYLEACFKRLKAKDKFLIGEYQGNIVAFAWLSFDSKKYVSEVDTEVSLENDPLMIYDCRTHANYRRKNIYSYMLTRIIEDNPKNTKYIYCRRNNYPSKAVLDKIFTPQKELHYLKLFGIRLKWKAGYGREVT